MRWGTLQVDFRQTAGWRKHTRGVQAVRRLDINNAAAAAFRLKIYFCLEEARILAKAFQQRLKRLIREEEERLIAEALEQMLECYVCEEEERLFAEALQRQQQQQQGRWQQQQQQQQLDYLRRELEYATRDLENVEQYAGKGRRLIKR